MRGHLERAVSMAAEQGFPAARCEALSILAISAAALGASGADEELLSLAERVAVEAKELQRLLPGHAPWGARADAALATVALAQGSADEAVAAARSALEALQGAMHEDQNFDVVLPAAEAIALGGTDEERRQLRDHLALEAAVIANRVEDEDVRTRWFRGPVGARLARLAAREDVPERHVAEPASVPVDDEDAALLRLVVEGLTNEQIGERLGVEPADVARRLAATYARIGAKSRADATVFAFQSRLL
jgi:DNA-binding NarL/FixJ family response regulator